tara:strand:+ start:7925 stop:8167 length:243 start_codon:yes stop_codon:yes gene_type:complete
MVGKFVDPFAGLIHLTQAIGIMNRSVRDGNIDLDTFRKGIETRANHPGLPVHEVALWETYKDFLDPEVNPDFSRNTPKDK